ncbi:MULTISPECIES: chemotaxis protein CheW [Fischerella]|uniref:Chemotaxis protein CheW n=1 Tax=Fischerella muscicola CCMEE 5323 TaxID=2019572 RepID=A0A2N6JVL8_FISMU|nr:MULTISPECIES: chemotaxis protein CheW [Fischerella]MBD2430500.1 purine-binding chemotaxis protein CheW [Fischerella sp. FACHB-380]PLZ83448.1 chemotaxis protein CheW [Fischerella muscicola CCMEE 5323]
MNNSKITLAAKPTDQNLGDGYLRFQLNKLAPAVLPMRYTQEAIVVPVESITSMPNMPSCILGLMNWRSHIVWVVDLPRMFNLESLDHRFHQFNIIIIRVESLLLGLVVQEIKGTTKFMPDEIRSPVGQVASSLVPYLRGCVVQQKEVLLVLDAQAIVQSSILHGN